MPVAYRPRFGVDSQARTPQLVWASWRETQLCRNQLERHSLTGTSYPFASHAIHLRGLAKVSLNALPRFSSTFEYDTKRCVE
jgi:hypothetical protein